MSASNSKCYKKCSNKVERWCPSSSTTSSRPYNLLATITLNQPFVVDDGDSDTVFASRATTENFSKLVITGSGDEPIVISNLPPHAYLVAKYSTAEDVFLGIVGDQSTELDTMLYADGRTNKTPIALTNGSTSFYLTITNESGSSTNVEMEISIYSGILKFNNMMPSPSINFVIGDGTEITSTPTLFVWDGQNNGFLTTITFTTFYVPRTCNYVYSTSIGISSSAPGLVGLITYDDDLVQNGTIYLFQFEGITVNVTDVVRLEQGWYSFILQIDSGTVNTDGACQMELLPA